MEKLNKNIVREILTTIQFKGIVGSQLLSTLKEKNPNFDETNLYMTLKALTEQGSIDNYIASEDDNCKVKMRYKLSEKGKNILNSL